MANIFQNIKDAVGQQTQKNIDTTTAKIRQYSLEMARASKETATFSSDAVNRGRITLDNFGKTFDNATRKVLVWQVAIMSVYGVMRKVGSVIQDWKDLELTLARISITTGAVGVQLQNYFRQVADIAVEFGMPIKQTLVGMDLALRATASLGHTATRTAVAVQLLRDASILANLTGMQYSQSMDILVGALRQTGLSLDQGIKLLDKWTAVSKNAAVSINDLSQGFAIMADAAQAAGLDIDQMNGLIAALSEKVTLGPIEIGNAIRSLMSTLYNQASISALQKFGVAVQNTAGEARNFWDVMTQLSAIRVSGVLDESAWLEIARAAGGGARRYAQFIALLDAIPTAMNIANISASAQGQALEANDKIVNTLVNTWEQFTESQRKLFMSLGIQTGAIEDLTTALAGLTNFISKMADAGPGIWNLARAFAFLMGTLGSIKLLTAAFGWLGVAPRLGGFLGGFAGISRAAVTGTGAQMGAVAGLQASAQQAQQAARIAQLQKMVAVSSGTDAATLAALTKTQTAARLAAQKAELALLTAPTGVAPGAAGLLGLGALRGLLPGGTNRLIKAGYAVPAGGGGAAGYMYGMGAYGPMYQRGAIPAGVPQGMTWGRMGQALTKPAGFGMGTAIAGLGAGAAAYGLTGEALSGVGSALGAAAGLAFGGPVGLAAGAAIGTLIGHTITDALISDEERIKSIFKEISEDFAIDLSEAQAKYFGKTQPTNLSEAIEAAQRAAPTFPLENLKSSYSWFDRLKSSLGLGGEATPFLWGTGKVEEEWKTGTSALYELSKAVDINYISVVRYQEILKETQKTGHFAWNLLTDDEKALLSTMREAYYATGDYNAVLSMISETIGENISKTRELLEVENRYSVIQSGIKNIIKENNLVQWESTNMQNLLASQMKMTDEEFEKMAGVVVGSSYAYATHLEAVERLTPVLKEMGLTLTTIPKDEWLLLQRWDPTLAGKINETATELTTLINAIDKFKIESLDKILAIPGVEGTIDNLELIRESLRRVSETTGNKEYIEFLATIDDIISKIAEKANVAQKFSLYSKAFSEYQRPSEIRLVDKETLDAYRQLRGQLTTFTVLAESLKQFETSVITLVDPISGQTLKLEENTLALQMLQQAVGDNTKQLSTFEAEYNLPSDYARPSRYWYYRSTGSTEFGPQQQSLWAMWENFIKERGKAGGGPIEQTGAYFLHRGENVLNADILSGTNNILIGSHQVLVNSQNYLSQINMGIVALREEVASLRGRLGGTGTRTQGESFSRVTGAGMGGDIPTFGARGLLD